MLQICYTLIVAGKEEWQNMKNNINSTNPYATNKGGKIEAPKKQEGQPKSTVVSKTGDLRTK